MVPLIGRGTAPNALQTEDPPMRDPLDTLVEFYANR
jgi:hypothetical protein